MYRIHASYIFNLVSWTRGMYGRHSYADSAHSGCRVVVIEYEFLRTSLAPLGVYEEHDNSSVALLMLNQLPVWSGLMSGLRTLHKKSTIAAK